MLYEEVEQPAWTLDLNPRSDRDREELNKLSAWILQQADERDHYRFVGGPDAQES